MLTTTASKTRAVVGIICGAIVLTASGCAAQSAREGQRDQATSYAEHCTTAPADVRITGAVYVPAASSPGGDGAGGAAGHCRLDGVISERTGQGGVAYGIRFAIHLPDVWSERFLLQGGGGLNGRVPSVLTVTEIAKAITARFYGLV